MTRTLRQFSTLITLLLALFPAALRAGTGEQPRFIRHDGAVPSEYIVVLSDGTLSKDIDAIVAALARDYRLKVIRTYRAALQGFQCRASERAAQRLAKDGRVGFVEENATGQVAAAPVWPGCSTTTNGWTRYRINHRDAAPATAPGPSESYPYQAGSGGKDVIAFVLDTGVKSEHTQFKQSGLPSRVHDGYDAILGRVDPATTNPCGNTNAGNGPHGTAVASLLGGETMGVAPKVIIEPVRVVPCTDDWNSADVVAGLEWVANYSFGTKAAGFKGAVLNMSFEGMATTVDGRRAMGVASIKAAVARVAAKGVVPFTVAGNFPYSNGVAIGVGDSCEGAIAHLGFGNDEAAPHVVVTSGTDLQDKRRSGCPPEPPPSGGGIAPQPDACAGKEFGRGPCVDLFAPATCVFAATLGPNNNEVRQAGLNGTSFASPLSAGVAARLLAENDLYDDSSAAAIAKTSYKVWKMMRDTATRGMVQEYDNTPVGSGSPNRLLYIGGLKITDEPDSVVVAQNDNGTTDLTVSATPTSQSTTYQWYVANEDPLNDHGRPYQAAGNLEADGEGARSATYHAKTDKTRTYWVRVTDGALTADSMLATVSTCGPNPRPTITAPLPGTALPWTLSVLDTANTTYEWYFGTPGDTNKRVPGGNTASIQVNPVATTEYWVRVNHGTCSVDSDGSVIVDVCAKPTITGLTAGNIYAWNPFPSNPSEITPSVLLNLAVTGTDLTYQWYQWNVSADTPTPYSTEAGFRISPDSRTVQRSTFQNTIQDFTFSATVTSVTGCGSDTSGKTTISFVPRLEKIYVRHPNEAVDLAQLDPNHPLDSFHHVVDLPDSTRPIRVPTGRAVALTAQPAEFYSGVEGLPTKVSSITWTDSGGTGAQSTTPLTTGTASWPYYVPNIASPRTITVKAQQPFLVGCNNPGGVCTEEKVVSPTLEACGSPLIETFPQNSLTGRASFTLRMAEGMNHIVAHDITVEWYQGLLHDDHKGPFAIDRFPSLPLNGKVERPLVQGMYWARVIGKTDCNAGRETEVNTTEDTDIFRVCEGRCRPVARQRIPKVNGTATTFFQLPVAGATVTIGAPDEMAGDTYQWRHGVTRDPSEPPFSTDATILHASAGKYWVRTTTIDGDTVDSEVTTIAPPPDPIYIPVDVYPNVRMIGAQSTLVMIAHPPPPPETCNVTYRWRQANGYGIEPHFAPFDSDSDPFSLTLYNLDDTSTFWFEMKWQAKVDGQCPPPVSEEQKPTQRSEYISITVICDPVAGVMATAYPDNHVAKNDIIRLLPQGQGKMLTYTWYKGEAGDKSRPPTYEGRDYWEGFGAEEDGLGEKHPRWVEAVDACGNVGNGGMVIYVCKPTITIPPAATTIIRSDQTKTLTITATPAMSQPLSYQWYHMASGRMEEAMAGQTSPTLSVTGPANTYWCLVSSPCSDGTTATVRSPNAEVTVCAPPTITSLTPSHFVTGNAYETLHVDATGPELAYQWYRVTDNTSIAIPGATEASYTFLPQSTATYRVRITSQVECSIDSNTITLTFCAPPHLTDGPKAEPALLFSGAASTLSVTAAKANPTDADLHYKWYEVTSSGNVLVGSDASTYTTEPLTASKTYFVRITSGTLVSIESPQVTVTVCTIPQTLGAPAGAKIASGAVTRLTGAYPTGLYFYRWYRGESGDTSALLSDWNSANYIDVAPTITTKYWYQLKDNNCLSSSLETSVTVCVPVITTHPSGGMINSGTPTTLSVVATPSNATYQWYIGASSITSSPMSGQTSSSITVSPTVDTSYWVRVTGNCGGGDVRTVDSNAAMLTICQPPNITQASPGGWIARGQSYTLGVVATGTNPTYQWYTGASNNTTAPINGATTANYAVSPQNTTSYWVRVSGSCTPPKDSNTITVNVCATPSITAQPQSLSIFSGATATLSVTATEATTSPVSYQWYRGTTIGDTSYPVGTGSTFTTPALTTTTSYWVRVSCGTCTPADSQIATVSICAYPQIIGSSGDVQTSPGQSTRIQASVSNPENQYNWYQGAASDTSHPIASGWNNYVDVAPSVTTQYWGQIVNQCVSRTNTVTVTVCVPQITLQPQGTTVQPGASATLTAGANTAGVTYQWYVGTKGTTTSPLSGQTGASVTVTPSATTSYWVRATSTCARTIDSEAATVTVCATPNITRQPYNSFPINAGQNAYMDVIATGTNLTYQWYQGEKSDTSHPFTNATGSSITVNLYNSVRAWVRVSGMCGSKDSDAFWLSVYPSIQTQPASIPNVGYGSTATVSITASGTALHYAWKNGYGAAIPGSTDSPKVILSSVTANTTVYCEVTSGVGTSATRTSAYADITLCDGNPYITSMPIANYGGNCRLVTVNVANPYGVGNWFWYQGARGDTSTLVGSGSSQFYACPATATQYWVRVVGYDDGRGIDCYTDSAAFTLP